MLFCEPLFLFVFLPLVVILYHGLPAGWRNVFLCLVSVLFYATGEARFLGWLAGSILINYVLARVIQGYGRTTRGRVGLDPISWTVLLSGQSFPQRADFILHGGEIAKRRMQPLCVVEA